MECWNCGGRKGWLRKACAKCGAEDEQLVPAIRFWIVLALLIVAFMGLALS